MTGGATRFDAVFPAWHIDVTGSEWKPSCQGWALQKYIDGRQAWSQQARDSRRLSQSGRDIVVEKTIKDNEPDDKPQSSVAKISGLLGIISVFLANIVAILTHIDEIRKYISDNVGTEHLYEIHGIALYISVFMLFIGYSAMIYWIYMNFIKTSSIVIKSVFLAVSITIATVAAVGSTLLIRPMDLTQILTSQVATFGNAIALQQVASGDSKGGFRFSQTEASNDVQVWTTAQCLFALIEQEPSEVKRKVRAIHDGLDFVRRSQLPNNEGWAYYYMGDQNWGVTEIASWVTLAYVSSVRPELQNIVWRDDEIPIVSDIVRSVVKLLLSRQHSQGGWGPISKTDNPKHVRTYSSLMAVWALVEAQNSSLNLGDARGFIGDAIVNGVESILITQQKDLHGLIGWWPNPSVKYHPKYFAGLTAQALYVLARAQAVTPTLRANHRINDVIRNYVTLGLDGAQGFEVFSKRNIDFNEQVEASDRYFEGRRETAEQSTFLWYPWTVSLAAELTFSPIYDQADKDLAERLLNQLLRRSNDDGAFASTHQAIFPTAESLFALENYIRLRARFSKS